MIAFLVIVRCEFSKGLAKRLFTEEDHPVETFGFHAAHESLDVRIWASVQLHVIKTLNREPSV